MKTKFLSFALAFSTILVSAQNYTFNSADFTEKSKILWEAAKKRFVAELGEKTTICAEFVSCNKAATQFEGGTSCIAVDSEKIKHHLTTFKLGTDENAAIATFEKMREIIKATVTDKFPQQQEYSGGYHKYMFYYYEFQHDVFSYVAKQPTAKIGLKKSGDDFIAEVYFVEPIFK
ncbi:MAG: hypothetical protein ACK4K0_03090 [Flavobacteriales bacterium]